MTIPSERTRALIWAAQFLQKLSFSADTPAAIRENAIDVLRHFPSASDIELEAEYQLTRQHEFFKQAWLLPLDYYRRSKSALQTSPSKPDLPPPKGYVSWLQYSIDTMDARGAFSDKMFEDCDMPTQAEVRAAAQAELDRLADQSSGTNQGLPVQLDDDIVQSIGDVNAGQTKGCKLGELADAANSAAGRASESIDDAMSFVEKSNLRIEALESGNRVSSVNDFVEVQNGIDASNPKPDEPEPNR